MKRIGTLMKLKPGALGDYIKIHDAIWDDVVRAANRANMRNYTIFRQDEYLFSYYEYIGKNFDKDMAIKNALPVSKEWQQATGAFRADMKEDSKVIMLDEIWHHNFD